MSDYDSVSIGDALALLVEIFDQIDTNESED
jgi:hypothetical protein